ncbi:MFS transporter [Streptomyces meridianus]|uniref:MFS transporter n=1 Tax=Streptomyces meridianus TaxID=2938945 RepID=A0ABT0XAH2_9ACTN|nr:MFS transporter [Streptomyces meridianus]MCM2579365.1 MFS transporter [Streptomyces meridianus]
MRRRLAVLAGRDFRLFCLGYGTSLLGSAMAPLAVAFAVLDTGEGGTGVGLVMAARILPVVLVLPVGGVVADRWGGRRVMLVADAVRCLTQLLFAAALLGSPGLGTLVALGAVQGMAEGVFMPSLGAVVPRVAPADKLSDANAVLGIARSTTGVAGPALAGILIALTGPALVLVVDALSYAVCFAALLRLPRTAGQTAGAGSFTTDLREGWVEFRSRAWLWVTSLHGCLFNLLVWAPFLVLGPVVADDRLGGAGGWGTVMALYGAGGAAAGLTMLGRRVQRPLLVGTIVAAGWALPSGALAAHLPLPWICGAALVAGVGGGVCGTLYDATLQSRVPPAALARVSAFSTLGAFAFGPLGLAAAGPTAELLGTTGVLGFGACWQILSVAVVAMIPAVRAPLGPGLPEPLPPARGDGPPGEQPDPDERRPAARRP